ncbi:thioredoxin family protein [Thalassobellus suaedae]|uniref:Thioredoxin family protein n=1 Tax=Thalassobellus suaedae TaxID=3074124 RepID=A0ABY9Y6L3_9FLAO|nr:thioredoxin family protein [Flavobacteriaceae bacterium HL-DH10]
MSAIIKNSLQKGISYQAYRELVKHLVDKKSNTGEEKTKALANYTKLNDKRMKRWDKTIKISEASNRRINEFRHHITWLVITESWCGDAAHMLPAINKIAELSNYIDMKIVIRDENLELMDAFLTYGSRSVPKLIMIDDETGDVLTTYGPRPSEATSYVNRFKAENGELTPEFKEDLQHWYNDDKGQNIIEDVTEMLCQLEPNVCQ